MAAPPPAGDSKGAAASEPAFSSPRGPPQEADKPTDPQVTKEMHSLKLKVRLGTGHGASVHKGVEQAIRCTVSKSKLAH